VERNVSQLSESVTKFFESALRFAHRRQLANHVLSNEVKIVSNLEWHKDMSLLDFLRIVGTQARVNTMLNRERFVTILFIQVSHSHPTHLSVQSRMSTNQGISYTEFTYQLLQAYDFYYLHSQHGCTIQMGGSDQWGNILAGIDLIGRLGGHGEGAEAYGITTPLLTTASGAKFGKSAGNAVWLDENLTSPFAFYQVGRHSTIPTV
jgi:tyrosyl-tRNA synthetase